MWSPGHLSRQANQLPPPCTLDGKLAKNQPAVSTSQACRKNTQLCRKLTIGSGNRRCRQNEFWIDAKSPMHSPKSDKSSKVGMATEISCPAVGLGAKGASVACGVYRSRCWSLCCKLTVAYRDRHRIDVSPSLQIRTVLIK
jgi:hypothetical protein